MTKNKFAQFFLRHCVETTLVLKDCFTSAKEAMLLHQLVSLSVMRVIKKLWIFFT